MGAIAGICVGSVAGAAALLAAVLLLVCQRRGQRQMRKHISHGRDWRSPLFARLSTGVPKHLPGVAAGVSTEWLLCSKSQQRVPAVSSLSVSSLHFQLRPACMLRD